MKGIYVEDLENDWQGCKIQCEKCKEFKGHKDLILLCKKCNATWNVKLNKEIIEKIMVAYLRVPQPTKAEDKFRVELIEIIEEFLKSDA